MDHRTKANSEAWNQVAKTHYEKYDVDKLLSGESLLSPIIVAEVGDVQGKSLLHLLCHIGTDTLSWGLLGAKVTGVDISPEAIKYARMLAAQMEMDATFIESNVMTVTDTIVTTYDVVFASIGVLCWIPDIVMFAAIVRKLLKPGGVFYLLDGHPFRDLMLGENEQGEVIVKHDYFHTGAWECESFTDYVDTALEVQAKSYEWGWTIGSIVTAFSQNGLRIEFLHEFPSNFYGGYGGADQDAPENELFPCSFSLKVVAV